MQNSVRFNSYPELNSPVMIAAWPGIGNVALIVATYLKDKLPFQELGEIEPSVFFDPIGVLVKDYVVESPQFPENKFYYWKNDGGQNDVILFIGEEQPSFKIYDLAKCVADAAISLGVKRVFTCAAALTHIHHTEQPGVWGIATSPGLAEELKSYNLIQRGNLHIAGLNGLLLGASKEKGLEGVCLLGEVPMYATRIQNPVAALTALRALTRMLGIEVDTGELTQIAAEAKEKMKQVAAEAMGEYIDNFTRPIWEEGGELIEEDDEEDDDEEDEPGYGEG